MMTHITHITRTKLDGKIVEANRTCEFSAYFTASKFDDNNMDPRDRISSNPRLEELDMVEHLGVIVVNDNGGYIGAYSHREMPEAEIDYWDMRIEQYIERFLQESVDDFTWKEVDHV